MFEEKWWNPKSIEQLIKEEKERQFDKWIKDKCITIVNHISGGMAEYYWNREEDGVMKICYTTKERYESCCFNFECIINIDDFWDKEDPKDMKIEYL